jgi:hypothetical protein
MLVMHPREKQAWNFFYILGGFWTLFILSFIFESFIGFILLLGIMLGCGIIGCFRGLFAYFKNKKDDEITYDERDKVIDYKIAEQLFGVNIWLLIIYSVVISNLQAFEVLGGENGRLINSRWIHTIIFNHIGLLYIIKFILIIRYYRSPVDYLENKEKSII